MAVHALGALVYGQLSLFVLDGFVDLRGRVAVCAALAETAFVCGLVAHRAVDPRSPGPRWLQRLGAWRGTMYLLAILLACVAFVLQQIDKPRLELKYPVGWPGWAPQSEWLLTPLPWVWKWVLPLAQDRLQPWLLFGVVAAGCLGAWCFSGVKKKPRAGLVFFGVALVATGFWSLGGAAYHYVAGRGLANVHDAALAAFLQARSGLYNADTLLWLLGAASLTLAGVLSMAGVAAVARATPRRPFSNVRSRR